jgi:hypothetical protein
MKEEVRMKFLQVAKGKLLIAVLAGTLLIGGATAAFASTPAGQSLVDAVSHRPSATTTVTTPDHKKHHPSTQGTPVTSAACPGLPDALRLARAFSLSTASTSDAVQAICELHRGTFKGTTPAGVSVTSSHVFGYGDIAMLLVYARYLAAHNAANTGGKLTTTNARGYLAQALNSCAATPLMACLKTNIPGFKPGSGSGWPVNAPGKSGHGKPTGPPTTIGKPTSTPTPHH